ncbi:MAG: glycosyltransferase family A protein [Planctomycetia bacterium]|nr:glycosyltransferase family A protein [Planctomycetia bacterium]
MARVTIGVPVFNAESLLERSLDNLAAQTFRDFNIIVLDNASTDRTSAIIEKFVQKDTRFSHRIQPYNKGCRQNFVDVLAMAETPYFMWRAYDDYSSVNFIDELVRLLDATPNAALAVGRTVMEKRGRSRVKVYPQQWPSEPNDVYAARLVVRARAGWIYGLYRTNELRWSLNHVVAHFEHVHAFDPLTILPFLIQRRVVGTDKADFIQGFVDVDNGAQESGIIDPEMMQKLRDDFRRYCSIHLPSLVGTQAVRGLMKPALWHYADRSYRWLKILNARTRMFFGEKPHAPTTKYDAVPVAANISSNTNE